jgi:xylulokinase
MPKILAIDLGTTYFKFALFDRAGQLCDVCRLATPSQSSSSHTPPQAAASQPAEPPRAEIPAEAFHDAIAAGIAELRDRDAGRLSDLEAVTFATQTNSFILLDAALRPLTPIILWSDRREDLLEVEARRQRDLPNFAAMTGVPQLTYQFMLAKLLWLERHSPHQWERMRHLCQISDYLTLLLTGKRVTEAGVSGLTGLVDIHRCGWWPDSLAAFHLSPQWLPAIERAGADLGPIDPQAARRLGLPGACRFIVGCLDQYAGAIGVGNVEAGGFSETTGTVLATVQCADRFSDQLGPAVYQGPAFRPGLYWRMSFGDVSANYLEWYRDQLPDRPDFDRLLSWAEAVAPGAAGLRLRTEVKLTRPEEVFEGLTPQHTPGQVVRCILETVAAKLAEQMESLSSGARPECIRCAGGGARSGLWLQIKADRLDIPTMATQNPEPTSMGAAMLAEAALTGADLRQIAAQWVRPGPVHRPMPPKAT